MIDKIKEYAKFVAALIGAFVTAFSTLIPAEWGPWLTAVAAFLTAVAVLTVPNAPTTTQVENIAAGLGELGVASVAPLEVRAAAEAGKHVASGYDTL